MEFVHILPEGTPHLEVLERVARTHPENKLYALPGSHPGLPSVHAKVGFLQRLIRKHRPRALVVHNDQWIPMASKAWWPKKNRTIVHRYAGQPLKMGMLYRPLYRRAWWVADGPFQERLIKAALPETHHHKVRTFVPRVGPLPQGAPLEGGKKIVSVRGRSARPTEHERRFLSMLERRFCVLQHEPWEVHAASAESFVFLRRGELSYNPEIVQASRTGRPTVVFGLGEGEYEDLPLERRDRFLPNELVRELEHLEGREPDPTPYGSDEANLMHIYQEFKL